ncbi:MAG: ParB/RepB/Spo0J family partition protein [Nitrososphaerales archaeon]
MDLNNYLDFATMVEPVPIRAIQPADLALRKELGDLSELISSIRTNGLLQPILIRPIQNDKFVVVAGMRRFEACKRLHWFQIPAVVREMSSQQAFELALVENIQRQSMDVLDEARAFKRYVDSQGWGSMKELALKIGKSESYVSHRIMLLLLPESIQQKIESGEIKPSTAKQLVWLESPSVQEEIARKALELKLSTSATRELIKNSKQNEIAVDYNACDRERDGSDPDFIHYYNSSLSSKDSKKDKKSTSKERALDHSILAMKLALARLDLVRDKCSDSETQAFVQDLRYKVHGMIDECIRKKKEIERREKKKVLAAYAAANPLVRR